MQKHSKIQLIILNIIVLALIGVSNFAYAQQLHDQTLYEISRRTPTQVAHITVGKHPVGIGVFDDDTNRIYVANGNDNTVSVIDGATHTVIGKPITVGKYPIGIGVNDLTNTIYVTNAADNTVSVINANHIQVLSFLAGRII